MTRSKRRRNDKDFDVRMGSCGFFKKLEISWPFPPGQPATNHQRKSNLRQPAQREDCFEAAFKPTEPSGRIVMGDRLV